MNVLIISHMYPSNANEISGIFVHKQVKNLKKLGCNVKVISPKPKLIFPFTRLSKDYALYKQIPFKEVYDGIEVYRPYYNVYPKDVLGYNNGIRMYKNINNVIKNICSDFKIDIINSHVALPNGLCGYYLKREIGVPHVVTIHGDDFQYTINRSNKHKRNMIKVLNDADEIIAISNKLKNIVKSFQFYNKIKVINNGIDLVDRKIEDYTINKDDIIILSVGNLYNTKGIDINLKSLKNLINEFPSIKYIVIGDGPEKENLIKLTNKLGIKSNVDFLGRLSNEKVIEWMHKCTIFSLPSWREGFGIVYIEAMSQAKPVIGIKGEGIEDAIIHDKNGILVEGKNYIQLEKELKKLIMNKEMREKIGKNAKKTVLEKFTWDINAKKTYNLYENILKRN
ncbi:glycosyltransferase [Clostridium sporogenes]|uniref:Glycosyltransferase n=1 Tax=Clostridium sporogenes TaxID=1509 RepID=A0AAE4FLZ8_CLOSG|nr:glycosyltransferase [Clostridium sporogenes]MDS1003620.1 glycosyltransferase [Clostridium sporogenes]